MIKKKYGTIILVFSILVILGLMSYAIYFDIKN